MNLPVFLSASEPYRARDREYWDSRSLLNLREAVRSLAAHVLPHWPLVFGGHPTITPLVTSIADRIRHVAMRAGQHGTVAPQLLMFQSRLYVSGTDRPETVLTPSHYKDGSVAPPRAGSRNASLLRMRYEMLAKPEPNLIHPLFRDSWQDIGVARKALLGSLDFSAAVFIGGMEGVEREFCIFRSFHPHTPAFPIASTGSAAGRLLEQQPLGVWPRLSALLRGQTSYSLLFEQLLPSDMASPDPIAVAQMWSPSAETYPPESHLDPIDLDMDRSP